MISPVKIWRRQKEIRKYLNKQGKIISWTKIFTPAAGFKKYSPYPVVMVEFGKEERVYGQLVDWEAKDLKIGKKVKAVLRKVREGTVDGVIAYGVKFKPL